MLGALKFNSAKCETTCRLCLGRIKLLKNKRNMQMKQYRRDIAELLRAGKQDYARIRVEAVIREAFTLTAYEILELYLELLAVRSSLVANSKEIPRDMVEALSSVLYATSRVPDLPELTTLHKMFAQKYGKEYVSEACSDVSCRRWMVNENLQRCLTIEPPEPAVKLETLSEIAQEYGVEWDMYRAQQELLPKDPGPSTTVQLPCIGAAGRQVVQQQQQPHLQQQGYDQAAAAAAAPAASSGNEHAAPGNAAGLGDYADVAAAAAAAVAAAQQARSAAEAAARMAGAAVRPPQPPGSPPPGGRGGGGGGGGGGGMAVPAAGSATAAGPPNGWLSTAAQQQAAASKASGPRAAAGAPVQMQPLPQQQPHQQQQQQAPPSFRMPSAEEIQRAYDSAQGPPAKPAAAAVDDDAAASAGPAVAPPAGPPVRDEKAAAVSASVQGGGSTGDLTALPGVPSSGLSAAASSGAPSSEYDELQKRFEALKKA